MPISAANRAKYPRNWREIRQAVLVGADHRCEFCGVLNHSWGWRDDDGQFHPIDVASLPAGHPKPPFMLAGRRIIAIVLTTAHLDHQPENCALDNLRALCQRCHLAYDAAHHARNRATTRQTKLQQAR